jgi:type III secretion protein L
MPILEPPHRAHPRGRILPAAEAELWRSGAAWLDEARRQAAAMRAEAASACAAERVRGFDEGRRAGAEAAAGLLASTAAKADAYLRRLEPHLPDLVLDAVERLLGERDPDDAAARAVRHAVGTKRSETGLTLRVAPGRVDDMRTRLADLLRPDRPGLSIEGDPALAGDAAILASAVGFVEVGLQSQLAVLRAALAADDSGGTPETSP